ncbi:unnamed protein product [Didymodactylos carnosus]|uniref:Protein YIPF n=1 Tax=Didymodactylos carnosus TaxID=1234261 RepID=A0A813RU31_9BILA|nr:unnamed protein product [Didymodactylos carnosus]CAF3569359.1 unnamed protein product [Didymodactylos carnosus]
MSWNPEQGFLHDQSYPNNYYNPGNNDGQQNYPQQQFDQSGQYYQHPHQQQSQTPYPTQFVPQPQYQTTGGNFMPPPSSAGFYKPSDYMNQNSQQTNPTTPDELVDEPPLLEELGINFDHIFKKTKSVLNPFAKPDTSILDDSDLAGPLVFCFAFGFSLLLLGKIHFGYVYGIVLIGCFAMYSLLNMMSEKPCSGIYVTSVLGYCLLPMVLLSFSSFLFKLNGPIGLVIAAFFILWCSLSASKLFSTSLSMIGQQVLVAYPCCLFYGVFALLTIF